MFFVLGACLFGKKCGIWDIGVGHFPADFSTMPTEDEHCTLGDHGSPLACAWRVRSAMSEVREASTGVMQAAQY